MAIAKRQNRPAKVLIDPLAMRHNLSRVRVLCSTAKVMAVIKADGYGHGMEEVANALIEADEFAVNGMDDVRRLRAAGIDKRLTLLSEHCDSLQLQELAALNVRPTLFDLAQIDAYTNIGDDSNLSIWLKVDTGMGRLGISPDELPSVMPQLIANKGISDIALMTHLANADTAEHPQNHQQLEVFEQLAKAYGFSETSILNSAGIINFAEKAASAVRPGIMLYGISPTKGLSASQLQLQPAMTFKSELISVKNLAAGSSIGYGSTYVLEQDSRIGVVACGYGDGYPRHAKTGTPVFVNGLLVPLIGRVSMDMLTVDLSDVTAQVGDEVELWGPNLPIETVAESADTIGYELCCGILPRVARITINSN